MTRTCEAVMKDRMGAALALVEKRVEGSPTQWALLSHAEVARELGLTVNEARCVLRRLEVAGLTYTTHCFLPNGGQTENALCLTPAGQAFLHEAGLCGHGKAGRSIAR